jgi:hypothetical protein
MGEYCMGASRFVLLLGDMGMPRLFSSPKSLQTSGRRLYEARPAPFEYRPAAGKANLPEEYSKACVCLLN